MALDRRRAPGSVADDLRDPVEPVAPAMVRLDVLVLDANHANPFGNLVGLLLVLQAGFSLLASFRRIEEQRSRSLAVDEGKAFPQG